MLELPTIAIIPSATLGSRMIPLSNYLPKVLLPLGGKPLIINSVEMLENAGIRHVIIVIEPVFGPMIKKCFEIGYKGRCVVEFVIQEEMTGYTDAILLTQDLVKDNKFIVCMPDIYYENAFCAIELLKLRAPAILVKKAIAPKDLVENICVRISEDGYVKKVPYLDEGVLENNTFATGLLAFDSAVFKHIRKSKTEVEGDYSVLVSVFNKMVESGDGLRYFLYEGYSQNINTIDDYDEVVGRLLRRTN